MDTLEVITAETSLEDEIEFLEFARRNRHVRIISWRAFLEGIEYLSTSDLPKLKKAGSPDERTFLLWNSKIANPLCWSLSLLHYDSNWRPIDPRYAIPLKYPHTLKDFLAVHQSFKSYPITERTFRYGRIDQLLSPVIEVSIPSEKNGHYFSITAEFSNWIRDVWLVWNASEERWEHETRDLARLFEQEFEQPAVFIEWQEQLFDWIRKHWPDKILPSWTYRYGPDD